MRPGGETNTAMKGAMARKLGTDLNGDLVPVLASSEDRLGAEGLGNDAVPAAAGSDGLIRTFEDGIGKPDTVPESAPIQEAGFFLKEGMKRAGIRALAKQALRSAVKRSIRLAEKGKNFPITPFIRRLGRDLTELAHQQFSAGETKAKIELSELPGRPARNEVIQAFAEERLGNRLLIDEQRNAAELILSNVDPNNARLVREKTGVDISGLTRIIDSGAIGHVSRTHGPGSEVEPGQVPVTSEIIGLYLDVVENPDTVKARVRTRKPGLRSTIEYWKKVNGTIVVVEEIRTKTNKLAFRTMYVREAK